VPDSKYFASPEAGANRNLWGISPKSTWDYFYPFSALNEDLTF